MISLCLTNYNRDEMLMRSFEKVVDHPAISEIIISDDCSDSHIFNSVKEKCTHPKIKLFRNDSNLGMSRNKAKAIELASNDKCIIFDSDNGIGCDYIDRIEPLDVGDTIMCPDFAKPKFDYRGFDALLINKKTVKENMGRRLFDCLINTCNYVVSRSKYLEVYEYNPEIKASDTIWHAYNHLKTGGSFYVVPGLQYEHTVHDGSGFLQDAKYNLDMADKIKSLILAL